DAQGGKSDPEERRVALDALADVEDESVAANPVLRIGENDVSIVDRPPEPKALGSEDREGHRTADPRKAAARELAHDQLSRKLPSSRRLAPRRRPSSPPRR